MGIIKDVEPSQILCEGGLSVIGTVLVISGAWLVGNGESLTSLMSSFYLSCAVGTLGLLGHIAYSIRN